MKVLIRKCVTAVVLLAVIATQIFAVPVLGAEVYYDRTFTDTFTGLDNLYDYQNVEFDDSFFTLKVGGAKVPVITGSLTETEAYVVYKTDYAISDFEVLTITSDVGDESNSVNLSNGEFEFYTSADGEEWDIVETTVSSYVANTVSDQYSASYKCVNTESVHEREATYLKIEYPDLYADRAGKFDWLFRSLRGVEITTKVPESALPIMSIKGGNILIDMNAMELEFTHAMLPETLIAEEFEVLNTDTKETAEIASIDIAGDNMSCTLNFTTPLEGASNYKISVSGDVKAENDEVIPETKRTITFTTVAQVGDYEFIEPLDNYSNLYEYKHIVRQKAFGSSSPDYYFAGTGNSAVKPYLVYKLDGSITSFHVEFTGFGGSMNADTENPSNDPLNFYGSIDGVNFTEFDGVNKYSQKDLDDWGSTVVTNANHYRYTSSEAMPSGTRYLKIEFPFLKGSNGGAIRNIKIGYTIGQSTAFVKDVRVDSVGEISTYKVDVGFVNPMVASTITPEMFTVDADGVSCISVDYDSDASTAGLVFDNAFDFDTEYTLSISDTVLDVYGFPVDETGRTLPISFAKPEKIIVNSCDFSPSTLTTGVFQCTINIESEYADGNASQNIMPVLTVFQNGRMENYVCSEMQTLTVGDVGTFILSVNLDTVSSDAVVKVFLLDDWQNRNMIADVIVK